MAQRLGVGSDLGPAPAAGGGGPPLRCWGAEAAAGRRRGARVALLNGRFSDRGFRRAARARPLYRWALGHFDQLLLQTELDAERAVELGAPAERLRVAGNTKF